MTIGVLDKDGNPQTISTIDDLMALIGSGASPAANTVQARLESLKTFVDGLETLLGTTNSALTTLDGRVDGLEALVGSTNTALATLNSQTDTLESLIGTTNSTLTSISGFVDGLEGFVDGLETNTAAIASTNTKLDSIIAANQAPGPQLASASTSVVPSTDGVPFGLTYFADASTDITRPADANPYAINDVLANSTSAPTTGGFTLANMARATGGGGMLTDMIITSSAVPGTLLQGEIHLFDQAVTAVNDNAAWALSDADAKNRIAVIPFTLLADANNSYVHLQNLNIGYRCVSTRDLRYLVKVKNAYTPASGEVLTVRAKGIGVN